MYFPPLRRSASLPLAIAMASGLLAGCASSAAFPPPPALSAKAYDGPVRPEVEVATVFILDGRPRYESGYICQVDDKPVTPPGGCASVVYLLPGSHRLAIRYQSHIEVGEGQTSITVEAGKLYQLNATSFRTNNRGMISLLPMPGGTRLTYRNVAPGLFSGPKADEPVPYGAP
jgi:hypothetical protein